MSGALFCAVRFGAPTNGNKMSKEIFKFLDKSASSDYVKLADGDKKSLRILSQPVYGSELFVEGGKPIRWRHDATPPADLPVTEDRPRKFLAFVVYEYDTGRIKIWQFGQRGVIDQMAQLFGDDHWSTYELVLSRRGAGMDTKYSLVGIGRQPEENLIGFAAEASEYVDLEQLFTGGNPFIKECPEISVEKTASPTNTAF